MGQHSPAVTNFPMAARQKEEREMKKSHACLVAASISLVIGAQTANAEEIKMSGLSCATGDAKVIALSGKHIGMTVQLSGTYVDDKDEANNREYRCIGSLSVVGGKPLPGNGWCIATAADGSSLMATYRDVGDGTNETKYVDGTGRFEGATGGAVGEESFRVGKPPKGKFALCRRTQTTLVLKDK